ncbi:hypothetical protein [Desulfovibrio inopinatus]|uniref:hypothetical protein n=1 Tax=Desulfovibrio inopinatus TaxID=102109 RepID=UPI0004246647|nr:hypothetical protein [Desulfovibrio inopinatus]
MGSPSDERPNQHQEASMFGVSHQELIFRKAALDQLAEREELDQYLNPVPRRRWLIIMAGVSLLIAELVWLIWGERI